MQGGDVVTEMCISAANYLIERTNNYNSLQTNYGNRISMTCKRLQKLLYFSDIEYMKRNNSDSMFRDNYHAWPSGPVIPSVYSKFMTYQNGQMKPIEGKHSSLTQAMKDCLDFVLSLTWNMDTLDLIDFTHVADGPWKQVYNESDPKHEQIIPKRDIFNYYRDRAIFE